MLFKKIFHRKKTLEEKVEKKILFFTKDFFDNPNYDIGDYSYGKPKIYDWGSDVKLKIGKFCSIANDVVFFLGGNHRTDWITTYPFNVLNEYFPEAKDITGHPSSKGDLIIGNDVWIGDSSLIMSGIEIGDGAVIGARSVLTKSVKPYEIWAGNPAKFIRKRFDEKIIDQLCKIKWWDLPIEDIKQIIPLICDKPENNLISKIIINLDKC